MVLRLNRIKAKNNAKTVRPVVMRSTANRQVEDSGLRPQTAVYCCANGATIDVSNTDRGSDGVMASWRPTRGSESLLGIPLPESLFEPALLIDSRIPLLQKFLS